MVPGSNPGGPTTFLRRPAAVAAVLVLAVAVPALGAAYLARDPTARILARRSRLACRSESPPVLAAGHEVRRVRLVAESGLAFEMAVKRSVGRTAGEAEGREPGPAGAGRRGARVVVLLGGHRTGRDAVDLVPDTRGAVLAALSYPYHGDPDPRGIGVLRAAPDLRAAALDAPAALMLALDDLLDLPQVDRERVEIVGVSLGVPFVCAAAALDGRFRRVWAIHGAGRPYSLLEFNLRDRIPFGPARLALAALADLILDGPGLAPERWAGRIAPRPFVMINAQQDERLPRAAVDALYRSAREPRAIVWIPGTHVAGRPGAEMEALVTLVLERMSRED